MSIDERFEQIAHNFEIVHDSIKGLETIAGAHQQSLESLEATATAQQHRMDKLADTVTTLVREWQAYLRRIPHQ